MTVAIPGSQTAHDERAIENGFPSVPVSRLAEHESWRKELYRPIYYMQKWWARRLGSVFRAIIVGACSDRAQDIYRLFYEPVHYNDTVVFDPFMGSGVTIGEAAKLGCRVIGRDINPVSYLMACAALREYSTEEVKTAFHAIAQTAGEEIRSFHVCRLPDGEPADVLYYFWVKVLNCPHCSLEVELFKKRVFAQHAVPGKNDAAKALCPKCRSVNDVKCHDLSVECRVCHARYNPQAGAFDKSKVVCPHCGERFSILGVLREIDAPPAHRMFAKMVLTQSGAKLYLPADTADDQSYKAVERMLPQLREYIPTGAIEPGYNTDQVLRYNYRSWDQMFNSRQLVSLGLLVREIRALRGANMQALFACLFSGVLEFNNMFASFKGEGTGAVRHMFAHHILKPELAPLEANVWGTPRSSGSFSTLFSSRILRALEYKNAPFEMRLNAPGSKGRASRVFGLSRPVNMSVVGSYREFAAGGGAYISAGDSATTDIESASVDLVVTDPPFFDNVHYSELADFFYVWERRILGASGALAAETTRSRKEVQVTDPAEFRGRLSSVLKECHRVLRKNGLLIFTYHHSRIEGWTSLYLAVREAGFVVTRTHPVKSEMSVSLPIQQSKSPITIDLIIVCRKEEDRCDSGPSGIRPDEFLSACVKGAGGTLKAFQDAGMNVSQGDARVSIMGCVLSGIAAIGNVAAEASFMESIQGEVEAAARRLAGSGDAESADAPGQGRLPLFT